MRKYCEIGLSALTLVLCFHPNKATAETWFVKEGASGTGLVSWSNAFGDLQQALAAASPLDEIRIAAGTYRPGIAITDQYFLPDRVRIRGGYEGAPGSENDAPAPDSYPTVLSGDLGANGNSLIVVWASGSTDSTRLEGVTISGAAQHAIYTSDSAAQFINLRVLQNTSFVGGAAMYNGADSFVTVEDCEFLFNETTFADGAAVYNAAGSRPSFARCAFEGNIAYTGDGAAVANTYNAIPTFADCLFDFNMSIDGTEGGGAIIFRGADDSSDPFPPRFILRNCLFQYNSSEPDSFGGGGAVMITGAPIPAP